MRDFESTALRIDGEGLWILDQTQLPQKEEWLLSTTAEPLIDSIKQLKVRGAPLIGVAAAVQLGIMAERGASSEKLEKSLWGLREARPTAVNLMNAMDRILTALQSGGPSAVVTMAEEICLEDVTLCEGMAKNGADLIEEGESVLTHCNSGGLATVGIGTALGCILYAATKQKKKIQVYVDETRPLLQGGRLTAWELSQARVPHTLICDNMAAALMSKGKVDRVMVGSDRIALNGDFANKIGTYGLAVSCKFHGIPFYVVAPRTTVDQACAHGADIPVEERDASEVRGAKGAFGEVSWAPSGSPVWNPAFDVTPEALVTAWILEDGVFSREDIKNGALKK